MDNTDLRTLKDEAPCADMLAEIKLAYGDKVNEIKRLREELEEMQNQRDTYKMVTKKAAQDIDGHLKEIKSLREQLPVMTGLNWVVNVAEFHKATNTPIYNLPALPTTRRAMFRANILLEEVHELQQATYNADYGLIADGIVDCLYVLIGTAHEHGIGYLLPQLFAEVHRSNMSKLGEDGKAILRDDGKVMKGPNFSPPDLISILDNALKSFK